MATPEIRLDGFDGEWEDTALGDLGFARAGVGFPDSEQRGSAGLPFYKVSDMNAASNQTEMTTANNFVTEGQIQRNGWSVIEDVPAIVFAKVGAAVFLGRKRLARRPFLIDNNMMSYSVDESSWDIGFARAMFHQLDLTQLVQAGALPSFNPPAVSTLVVQIPPARDEQRAIGRFFDYLDAVLENRRSRLSQLRRLKKTMLSKMFPRAGESVPEIRFDGFEGEWSNGAFGVLFSFLRNNSLPRAQLTNQRTEVRNVHYGDVLIKYGEVLDLRSKDVPYVISPSRDAIGDPLMNGDIVFADAAEDMTVGKCTELRGCDTGCVVSGLHTIAARPVKPFAQGFLGYALNSPLFHDQLLPLIQGTKVSSISPRSLRGCSVYYPTLDEQRAIGSYFTKLDQLIELEQAKHAKFQQLRTAFLNKMFV